MEHKKETTSTVSQFSMLPKKKSHGHDKLCLVLGLIDQAHQRCKTGGRSGWLTGAFLTNKPPLLEMSSEDLCLLFLPKDELTSRYVQAPGKSHITRRKVTSPNAKCEMEESHITRREVTKLQSMPIFIQLMSNEHRLLRLNFGHPQNILAAPSRSIPMWFFNQLLGWSFLSGVVTLDFFESIFEGSFKEQPQMMTHHQFQPLDSTKFQGPRFDSVTLKISLKYWRIYHLHVAWKTWICHLTGPWLTNQRTLEETCSMSEIPRVAGLDHLQQPLAILCWLLLGDL